MTRICWWLVEILSGMLEPDERDAVRGDLAESRETGGQALRDVLGLVARRQAGGWKDWRQRLVLEGLRRGLLRSTVGIMIGAGLCFYYRNSVYSYMARPLTDTMHALRLPSLLVYTNPLDPFDLYIKLSIMCGLFLASPYVLWQFWLLVAPGRYRHENRYGWPFVILTSTLFVTGGLLAYKLAVPAALRFVVNDGSRIPMSINEYWDLAITIMVGVGLVFELPGLCWLIYLKKEQGTKTTRSIGP